MDINQHGALHGRSTLTQLLDQQQEILKILENRETVEVLYLDFSKAFDSCDHSILLRKMKEIGFGGNLIRWLASFLSGRRQAVRVGDFLSAWKTVTSGVPQGSVLGPLMFLLYISDLKVVNDGNIDDAKIKKVLKFVDDTKAIAAVNN